VRTVPGARPERVTIVHCPEPVGRPVALNRGIEASHSTYIAVHDDDDSWHPDFLTRTLGVLRAQEGWNPRGIVTHCERVRERIVGDRLVEDGREPFNNFMQAVEIFRLAVSNSFPPIAFLYERAALSEVGKYDERLPRLHDWDMHLRFALHHEIELLPEVLAYYHHRLEEPSDGAYGNVVSDSAEGVRIRARLINRYLRDDYTSGRLSRAELLMLSELRESVLWQMHRWAVRDPVFGTLEQWLDRKREPG
jgi:glycosyltransferase involved in cell wall biosynthesis